MAKSKEIKTNAMRLLDSMKIPYETRTYECGDFVDGIQIADLLGLPHEIVYKTLVAQGASRQYYVYVIPVEAELDLKKAASAAGEKSVAMIKQKELLPLTGYVHGGCSPIGMKKQFPTFIHETAVLFDKVFVSAGKVGYQIELAPQDLIAVVRCKTADIV